MAAPAFNWQPSDADLEFIPLAAGARTAYESVVGTSCGSDSYELQRRFDSAATQLAAIAPVYTADMESGLPRLLTRVELMLGRFQGGGAKLVHRDRSLTHGDLRIRRVDLVEAIACLKRMHRLA